MKIINLFLTAAFALLSLTVGAQSSSLDIVKTNYPQIFTSIVQDADKQWGNDLSTKKSVIEGQARSFLEIINSQESIDGDIMTEAILVNSLPGFRNYNINIINDLSIENPFPLLKCDWYKVQNYYQKGIKNFKASVPSPQNNNSYPSVPAREESTQAYQNPVVKEPISDVPVRQREQTVYSNRNQDNQNYPTRSNTQSKNMYNRNQGEIKEYPNTYDDQGYQSYYERQKIQKDSPFHFGIRAGFPTGGMYNLGDYTKRNSDNSQVIPNLQVESKVNINLEGGLTLGYKKNGFLMEFETILQSLNFKYQNIQYTKNSTSGAVSSASGREYSNKYVNLNTAFRIGGYYNMGDGWHVVAGIGPYAAFNLSTNYDDYGIFKAVSENEGSYEKHMKDGEKKINYGLSGVFGMDLNNLRVAIYPNLGLSKINDKESYKPLTISLGFTYWIF